MTVTSPSSIALWAYTSAILIATSVSGQPINFHYLPNVFEESFSNLGDINIGALGMTLANSKTPGTSCSRKTNAVSYPADTTEAVAFAVDLINRDLNILPNITLGFVIRGVCSKSRNVALATSLSFLPRTQQVCERTSDAEGCDIISNNRNNSCSSSSSSSSGGGGGDGGDSSSSDSNAINDANNNTQCSTSSSVTSHDENEQWLSDDVIGVLSPDRDDLTTYISSLYSVANLPIIGATEVGDELSNKENHPYFFRISPPQQWQVKAILKFLSSNGWSYISILYQEGHYGQNAFQNMDRNVAKYGICIATSHMLDYRTDYDAVVADLLKYPRARVVVLFMLGSRLRKVLRSVQHNNASGHFIFVAGDLIVSYSGFKYVGTPYDPAIGMFVFDLYFNYVMEFYEYLLKQKVATTKNPWLRGAFEYIMECSYDTKQTKIRICNPERNLFETYRYRTNKATSLKIDAVLTYAHAVHNLLQDKCPGVEGKAARACITGPLLREYLKKVSLDGYNGRIEFDQNQDVQGKYVISQYVYDYHDYPFTDYRRFKHMTLRQIGVYEAANDTIVFYQDKPINWSHVKKLERVVPLINNSSYSCIFKTPNSSSDYSYTACATNANVSSSTSIDFTEIPESVCSRPCIVGEYRIVKDVPCCWECRTCRDNERLVHDNTSCESCPSFTWPDPGSAFTKCVDIPPTYPSFDDTVPLALISIAIICLIVVLVVFVTYAIYRDKRVIKASSRDLSLIQLVAISIGYVTVILHQATPTDVMCVAIFFSFCMSFALLYCPLLVKTIRIYRIFNMGLTTKKPWLIDNASQLCLSAFLVIIQIVLCVGDFIYYGGPAARRSQPIWTEKFVEMSCDLTIPGLVSFLAYNLVQVTLCSIFAFKVRQLPDNFNESRFISMCVSATLLIWLAFIPTYYTADRENIRTFLLSTALLLNHSVALVFLYLPKIYAARFLPQPKGTSSTSHRNGLGRDGSISIRSGLQSFTNHAFTSD